MTPYVLNPEYGFLANRAQRVGYVVSRAGGQSIVNLDAFDLLVSPDGSWQHDADYAAFLATALARRWLVGGDHGPAIVRVVDCRNHLKRIQYEIDLRCNLECAHCYCSSSPRAPRGKDTTFVLGLVEQAARMGVIYFDITGGEPMARNDLPEIMRSIRAHGMVPSLFTNCTLATPARVDELRAAGVAAVQTSLDAATPELHDEFRGRKGAFERALVGIRAFQEARIPISVSVSLSRRNAHQLGAIVELLGHELRVPYRLDYVIPAGRSNEHDDVALTAAEYWALVRPFVQGRQELAKKLCDSVNLAAAAIEPGCGVGATYMFIKYDGRAALCPTMTEAESPDFAHADLTEMPLVDAWERHPTFARFRGMQCENTNHCSAGAACRGGCRSNAYLLHGRVDAPDETSCNVHKNTDVGYRRFLLEYERARSEGRLPLRTAAQHRARRSLPVIP